MKKIVFVCDVNNFSSAVFTFLESLHKEEPFLLTGAFFHSVNFDVSMPTGLAFATDPLLAFTDDDIKAVNASIEKFEQKCELNRIDYRVHEESDAFEIGDFIKETRFTDLVVISQKLFFRHIENDQPNNYMKQVLHASECPVLMIPEDYSPATHVTLTYDGKKESMFAIKQFCYLFPSYTNLPTEVAYWVEKSDDEIPDIEYLEEFAARHFSNLNFKEHYFNPKKYMDNWVHQNRSPIFVFGSYKRSWLSNRFKKSFGDEMIRHSSAILFIAHS